MEIFGSWRRRARGIAHPALLLAFAATTAAAPSPAALRPARTPAPPAKNSALPAKSLASPADTVAQAAADSSAEHEAAARTQAILARGRAILGADDSVLKRVIVGRAECNGPDGPLSTEFSSASRGRFWLRQSRKGRKTYEALITPKGAWSIDDDGVRTPLTIKYQLLIASQNFQRIALDPASFARNLSVAGEEQFQGDLCQKLQGVVGDGSAIDFYFEEKQGRLLGFRLQNPVQAGSSVTVVFRDWMTVNGIQLPSDVLAIDNQGRFTYHFVSLFFKDEGK